jgi:ketosteroid isomerase-like protein
MGDLESSVRMFYERFGEGDMDGAASIYHDDVVTIEPALGRAESLAEWRAYGEAFRRACPDAHMVVQTLVESGETVAVEARFAGTFTGPLFSPQGEVPPTGNAFELPFADFFRFRGERVSEHHVYYDQLAFLSALGITPPPE